LKLRIFAGTQSITGVARQVPTMTCMWSSAKAVYLLI